MKWLYRKGEKIMEGLNKIRISNISYANGERYYDDLILDVGTKTLALDYINGGGKTFLAQCLFFYIEFNLF